MNFSKGGEQNKCLTLDGHSFQLKNDTVVGIPMRTFSGGYYTNLFQVLKFLGIKIKVRYFRYMFMERTRRHFQLYSNFHRIIPCFENGIPVNLFNFLCYLWFTTAVFLLPPRITNLPYTRSQTESLDEYARHIWLPSRFLDHCLLPLFASVATCTDDHLRCIYRGL
jgi:hypothetical protein